MNEQTAGAESPDSRRKFLNTLLATSLTMVAGSILYPVHRFLDPPSMPEPVQSSVEVGAVDDFPLNSGKIFKFGRRPGILVRLADGEFRAFNAICTHLDCTVQYSSENHDIWCACHNGHYDLNGNNISGPPPRPLDRYNVNIRNNLVFVSRDNITG